MFTLTNIEIRDVPPERVYVFPELLTQIEIGERVDKLHTIANEESDRTIYCLFDEVHMSSELKFEVCFPISHLDLKKYSKEDFRILEREVAVTGEFSGDFSKLSDCITQLTEFANEQGYAINPPYRYLFILHKKPLFSRHPPKFTMEIHIPLLKN